MRYINLLKYRLFGLKPKGKGIVTTGISHSITSSDYINRIDYDEESDVIFKRPIIWDKDKFDNIKTV